MTSNAFALNKDRDTSRVVRDVTTRGVRTRVIEAGRSNKQALVLVHGFIVNHLEFDDIIDVLAEDYHVVAPDLPGFGESEKPSAARYRYGIETFAEVVADVVAALDLGRPHVLGHSMGGAVALTLAAEHPELVHRLIVVDALSYPFPMGWKARLPLLPVVGGVIFKQLYGRTLYRSYFRDEVFRPGFNMPMDRIDRLYDLFNTPASRESAYAVMHAIVDTRPVVARIARVTAPTLVVWGREDKLFPVANAQRLARDIAGARLEIFEAGHSPHEEAPTEFLSLAKRFLESRK